MDWPEEGLGSCLLAGEGVVGAAVLLEGCARDIGWDFHQKSAVVFDCCPLSGQKCLIILSCVPFVGLGAVAGATS